MSKQVVGTLRIVTPGQALSIQGTLVNQDAESVTLDVKRRGSKKTDRTCYAATAIRQAFISDEVNETYLTVIGELVEDYPGVTLDAIQAGFFAGTMGESAVLAAPGTWVFLPDESEEEDTTPAPKGKAKAAVAPAAEPKGKGKAKAEPEPEEEPEEEQSEEEGETEAYEPAKGDHVNLLDGDEDIVGTGEVEAINSKTITVAGEKFKLADVTVVQIETPAADDAPEEEEEQEEEQPEAYEPAEGDYVTVTDADDEEVSGTVTAVTPKKVTIEDADGESHPFLLAKVTVVEATPPKKGKAAAAPKGKAAEVKSGKAAASPAPKAAATDDDW